MRLLTLANITCRFGALVALENVTCDVGDGDILGVLGPNGAGKSTLLNCVSGTGLTYEGEVSLGGAPLSRYPMWRRARAGLSRTFQTPRLLVRESVWENIAVGAERTCSINVWAEGLNLRAARLARKQIRAETGATIELLGLEDVAGRAVAELPFARRRLVEIGRALMGHPRLVLLDEPAAGLEVAERHALADTLVRLNQGTGLTMVVVEHDVGFLIRVASDAIALDFGRVIARGNIESVLDSALVRESYFGARGAQR